MKHYPPPPLACPAPLRRRRIPDFHPVPVGPRADGWTPGRQAAFIGYLAETGSVLAAARRVSRGRESAYRLRKRPARPASPRRGTRRSESHMRLWTWVRRNPQVWMLPIAAMPGCSRS